MMKGTTRFILLVGLALSFLANASGVTGTSFADQEGSLDNVLRCWLPSMWVQTTQADFAAGALSNVDITATSGDVILASVSNWYDVNWGCRAPVDISNPGSALTNYQVKVDITYDADMQTDFSDIRFLDSDNLTELSHWRESYVTSTSATFWVKVPVLPSGSKTVYLYYCNPAAGSSSNGDATFEFYDDFEDGDISDWSQYGSGIVQLANDSGNYVLLKTANNDSHGGYSLLNNGALSDFEAIFKTKRINETGGAQNRYGIEDGSFNGYGPKMADFNSLPAAFAIERRTGGSGSNLVSINTSAYQWNTWMTVKFRKSGSTLEFELYDSSGSLVASTAITNSSYNSFDRFVVHGGWEFYTDDVWVRQYANPEPTSSVGSEESNSYAPLGNLASQVFDSGAGAGWYDADWSYRRPVTLSPATSVANYQVSVTLTTAVMGNPYTGVNADGSDIRFTSPDGATPQDYWIESWSNTGTSRIWVEVVTSGTSTIYMYYGNAAASSTSDGDATFVFYDDFPGASLNGAKWGSWDATVSVAGSVATIANTGAWGGIASINEYSLPYRFVARAQKTTTYGIGQVGMEKWYASTGDDTMNIFDVWGGGRPQAYITSKYDGTDEWDEVGTWELSTWYHYEIAGKADEVQYYRDSVLENTETNVTAIPAGTMSVLLSSEAVNDQLIVDYCFVGKYVSPEPTTSVGTQELPDTTSWIGLSWDENLASNTDITFEVRASDTLFSKDAASPSWIAVGGSSPVTSGLPSGRYMQWRATLTTSDPNNTPTLHEVIVYYD